VRDLWPLGLIRRRAASAEPDVEVLRPAAYEEIATLLGSGRRVVPMGGRSGVCGAVEVRSGEVGLDLTSLDRILEVDETNLTVRVQAGANGLKLEEELNRRGLTLGHYPSSLPDATVGGLVSTRSSGQQSTLYGNVEDMLLALKVMLPDGTLAEPRLGPRSAVGPALHQLFVGAEGALGILLEAVFRVHRLPASSLGHGYDVASVEAGLEAMRTIVQTGLRPLVMRLYDREDTAFQASTAESCLLVIGLAGEPEVTAAEEAVVERLIGAGRDLGPGEFESWREGRFKLSADRLRQSLEPPGSFVDTIELAAGWDRLPALHSEVKEILSGEGIALCHFSHAYLSGCCAYFTFAGSAPDDAAAEAAYRRCWEGAMAAALRQGATIGHHHGTGQVRAPWVRQEMGEWWTLWEKLRAAVDPGGIMNPNALGGRDKTRW